MWYNCAKRNNQRWVVRVGWERDERGWVVRVGGRREGGCGAEWRWELREAVRRR